MITRAASALCLAIFSISTGPAIAADCASGEGLGVSRVVEIDSAAGPLFGDMSKYAREASFLGPKEVVLTFDDGPLPAVTRPILETLDKYCTKATFFSVGRMALAFPDMVKDIIARGHTFGGHTWSHANLRAAGFERARDEIEKGFAAMSYAAGQPVAPFFRFPYLNDSNPLLAHLQSRGIAAFTVDVVSNDSFISSVPRLIDRTMSDTRRRSGGIMLFHDIKSQTAKALPEILAQLKAEGYKVVHMKPKAPLAPHADYDAQIAAIVAKSKKPKDPKEKPVLVPVTAGMTGDPGLLEVASIPADRPAGPPVTEIAPAPKARAAIPAHKPRVVADNADAEPHSASQKTAPPRPAHPARTKRHKAPPPTDEPKRFFD